MTLRTQNERRNFFVFVIDYIEKMDNICLKSYSPMCQNVSRVIKIYIRITYIS